MEHTSNFNWPIVISAALVIFGWFVVNSLNVDRDRENKLRDIRTQYLIDAYRNLSDASQRKPEPQSKYFRQMESAVADIQLFGTQNQIEKVHAMLDAYSKTSLAPLDPILNDLRNELRTELNLPPINQNVRWLRMEGAPQLPNSPATDKR